MYNNTIRKSPQESSHTWKIKWYTVFMQKYIYPIIFKSYDKKCAFKIYHDIYEKFQFNMVPYSGWRVWNIYYIIMMSNILIIYINLLTRSYGTFSWYINKVYLQFSYYYYIRVSHFNFIWSMLIINSIHDKVI